MSSDMPRINDAMTQLTGLGRDLFRAFTFQQAIKPPTPTGPPTPTLTPTPGRVIPRVTDLSSLMSEAQGYGLDPYAPSSYDPCVFYRARDRLSS